MAARRGGGMRENHLKDEESRDEELHALRRQVERLTLLMDRLEARRKHGGSRSGYPYHEAERERQSRGRCRPSQRSKNRLWKIGSSRFQEWLEDSRDTCTKESEVEGVEELALEVKEFNRDSNVKVCHLFPFELEIKHEDKVDWNSPPIYDEYLDVESFDPTKENIGESLHDNNLDDSCLNGDQGFGFLKEVLACSDELFTPSGLDEKVLSNEQGTSRGAFLVCENGGVNLDTKVEFSHASQCSINFQFQYHDPFWDDFIQASINHKSSAKKELIQVLELNAWSNNICALDKFLERIELCASYVEKLFVNMTKETKRSKKIGWRHYELLDESGFNHANSWTSSFSPGETDAGQNGG